MSDSDSHEGFVSPGAQLAAARVRAGLSLDDVSRRSRVPRVALEALERDDWEGMEAPIYARGFSRLYAVEVGLDPDEVSGLVDAGRAAREQQAVAAARAQSRAARSARWGVRGPVAMTLLVVGMIALVLFLVLGQSEAPPTDVDQLEDILP